jgi:hypothetical protein
MEFVNKLETTIVGWVKNVPHLPPAGQKWLAQNVWWIALVGAILTGISLLIAIGGLFTLIALIGSVASYYYVAGAAVNSWSIVSAIVGLVILALRGLLLALSVQPLKAQQKKGWTLLFATWLLNILSVVLGAILTFSVFGFIVGILFGAIGIAISGYFLFEIHSYFAHAAGAARKVTAKKA